MRFPFSLQQRTSSGQLGFFSSFSTICWTRSGSSNSLYRSMSLCLPRSIRLSTCGLLSSYCSERSPGKFGGGGLAQLAHTHALWEETFLPDIAGLSITTMETKLPEKDGNFFFRCRSRSLPKPALILFFTEREKNRLGIRLTQITGEKERLSFG